MYQYKYLGAMIKSNNVLCNKIKAGIEYASRRFINMEKLFCDIDLSNHLKIGMLTKIGMRKIEACSEYFISEELQSWKSQGDRT